MNILPCRIPALYAALLALAVNVTTFAQDVRITGPSWIDAKDNPDELPVFRDAPRVNFPTELRQTIEIGYAVRELNLDEKGKSLGGRQISSLDAYQRAVAQDERVWSFKPGRRAGKGVNTSTVVAFIFNPASAAENLPNATPRLLEVAPVVVPLPKGAKGAENIPDRVIYANVSIDASGAVVAVGDAPPDLARPCEIAAKNWRFAPARRDGQPVAAEVRMPFVISTRAASGGATGRHVMPRVTSQPAPIYPFAMLSNGMKGEVLVDFVVDREGRVRNAFAARSLNPSFDDAAVDAVERWRFEPGRIGDRPVSTHMRVPVIFEIERGGNIGRGPLDAKGKKADLAKLPEEFRYDTPPRPIGTVRVVYPYELLRAGKTGEAEIGYVVGADGRVVQIVPSKATDPAFTRALTAAIEQFTYEPAVKAGRPGPALQRFGQKFDRSVEWSLVSDADIELLRTEEKKPESILNLRDLDGPLVPRSRRPPVFPVSAPEEMKNGEALVEFLVDQEGRARLPRIVEATHEAFAYAAMQSIASWRFESPQRGGRDVIVRVRIPMKFSRDATMAELAAK
jgi:TonB family protein